MDIADPTPMAQLSDTDQFMIMLNICAAVCGGFIYCLLTLRQKQSAGQRELYFPGPFMSLAEASQAWRVYRQCASKTNPDSHVCNLCGFTIRPSPAEFANQLCPCSDLPEETKPDAKAVKRRSMKKG